MSPVGPELRAEASAVEAVLMVATEPVPPGVLAELLQAASDGLGGDRDGQDGRRKAGEPWGQQRLVAGDQVRREEILGEVGVERIEGELQGETGALDGARIINILASSDRLIG